MGIVADLCAVDAVARVARAVELEQDYNFAMHQEEHGRIGPSVPVVKASLDAAVAEIYDGDLEAWQVFTQAIDNWVDADAP
jgi:hypothetical protein